VAVGTHDGVAANVGAGMLRAGEGCVTLGTNAVLRVNTTGPVDGRWTAVPFTYPFVGGGYTSGGDVPEAGATMAWLVRTVGAPAPVVSRLSGPGRRARTSARRFFTLQARLDDLAAAVPAGAEGLGFLPDVGRGASLVGLRPGHGPGHLARAIMEGTAFALGDVLEALVRRGHPVRGLRLTGGGSRSRLWTEIVAAILARPIGLVRPEASARGAAVLAAVAAGVWRDVRTATRRMVVAVGQVTPDPEARRRYARLRAGWAWARFGVARSS
jgi:sugar (pentulose or hexulose) kinase